MEISTSLRSVSESYLSTLPYEIACRILTRLPVEDVLLYWANPRFAKYFAPCVGLRNPWSAEYRVLPWSLIRRTGYDERIFGRLVLSLDRWEMANATEIRDVVLFLRSLEQAVIFLPRIDEEEDEEDAILRFERLLLVYPTKTRFILLQERAPTELDGRWAQVSATHDNKRGLVGSWPFAQGRLSDLVKVGQVSSSPPIAPQEGEISFQTGGDFEQDDRPAILSPSAYWFLFEADLGLEDPRRPPGPDNGRLKDKLNLFNSAATGVYTGKGLMIIAGIIALIRLSLGDTKGLDLVDKWYWPLFAPYAAEAEERATASRTRVKKAPLVKPNPFGIELERGLFFWPHTRSSGASQYMPTESVRGVSQRWVRRTVLNSWDEGGPSSLFVFMGETMSITELIIAVFPEVEEHDSAWFNDTADADKSVVLSALGIYGAGAGPIYLEDGTMVQREDIPKWGDRYPL